MLRNPDDIWVSLSTQLLPGTTYFRPVVLLTFIAEFKLFGVRPDISHAFNYFILLVNCTTIGFLAWHLSRGRRERERMLRAAFAVLIYGCNPVLLESAAWVSGRFDLLVTAFALLGLLSLSCARGLTRDLLVTSCFLFAIGSKEMAITFPALIVLWLWLDKRPPAGLRARVSSILSAENRRLYVFILIAGTAYVALRFSLFGGLFKNDDSLGQDFIARIAFVGQTLWFYLHMAVWPFADLSPIHPFDAAAMTANQKLTGVSIVLAFISVLLLLAVRGKRVGLLLLCGLLALLPVLNIAPLLISGNIGQERFLTLPVAFLALALAQVSIPTSALSEAMRRLLPWLGGALVLVWLALGALNIRLNTPLWGSEQSLWAWAFEKVPESDYVRFNYVASLLFYQREDEAERLLSEFEKTPAGLSSRMKGLKGQLLIRQQKYAEGLAMLDAGLVGEYQPHKEILEKGIDINKTKIVLNGYSGTWYIRFVYGAKAEAYLYLGDYEELNRSLDVMNFYDSSYAVIPMYRAFGAYAQNDIEQGNRLFAESIERFSKPVGDSAYAVRADFIKRFCTTRSDQLVCREKEKVLSSREGS
ncbi:hypothetical protein JVX91_10310 [Pseudomonas sp. PDNC002]|uniref:hypothetical protein n=1 Tax=Pseudomonas sp. PDNC002 TaxID=2811422 RepID=UPI0019654C6C|nr:hypothetical protein [Pseudomonas sp. PDNC002]QRY81463.1 hypothetical protein JVX91_10310 [Pseudomonas sp. PDNC002]